MVLPPGRRARECAALPHGATAVQGGNSLLARAIEVPRARRRVRGASLTHTVVFRTAARHPVGSRDPDEYRRLAVATGAEQRGPRPVPGLTPDPQAERPAVGSSTAVFGARNCRSRAQLRCRARASETAAVHLNRPRLHRGGHQLHRHGHQLRRWRQRARVGRGACELTRCSWRPSTGPMTPGRERQLHRLT